MIRIVSLLCISITYALFAHEETYSDTDLELNNVKEGSSLVTQIIQEQPDSIEYYDKGKLYLKLDRIYPTKDGIYLRNSRSSILLPPLFADDNGSFISATQQEKDAVAKQVFYQCTNPKCMDVWDVSYFGYNCPRCKSPGYRLYFD